MSDFINRADVHASISELPHEYRTIEQRARTGGIAAAAQIVINFPAADVVEVVRCKDCKYWVQRSDREYGLCNRNQGVWLNSDYCAKGKRKGGGHDDV